jgi:hypothetical protein
MNTPNSAQSPKCDVVDPFWEVLGGEEEAWGAMLEWHNFAGNIETVVERWQAIVTFWSQVCKVVESVSAPM